MLSCEGWARGSPEIGPGVRPRLNDAFKGRLLIRALFSGPPKEGFATCFQQHRVQPKELEPWSGNARKRANEERGNRGCAERVDLGEVVRKLGEKEGARGGLCSRIFISDSASRVRSGR